MWDVSRAARERGEPIDLPHYEQPPVETLRHALDRHAEEVYQALPTDRHRDVARLVFQQLTDRDAENSEVRRPTPLRELTAVALRTAPDPPMPARRRHVNDVIAAFAAKGREFVVVNAQQDVDISHESFIRKWVRLREWVDQEDKSRRVYVKLADVAARAGNAAGRPSIGVRSSSRRAGGGTPNTRPKSGPTATIAGSTLPAVSCPRACSGGASVAACSFGNIALLLAGAITVAVLMRLSRNAAFEVRNAADALARQTEESNRLLKQAIVLEKQGKGGQADALVQQAQQVQEAKGAPVLTSSELTELDRLRRQEGAWRQQELALRTSCGSPHR